MATNQLRPVIETLRSTTLQNEGAGLTDGQLLESYVHSREEAAFAALVRRHSPMVWGVCRRLLGGHHDAEDAFQATFLVLVRKAASITPKDMVANWLYGVAQQTALKARAAGARRRGREKQVTVMPEPALAEQELFNDLQPLLDQELSRLPDKYRAVIVLCDLEGKTRKEAARHFRLPEGTVASRLATARAMLARRLSRHGAAVSGAVLAAVLAQNFAAASVPGAVANATIKAASRFAAGQPAAPGVLSVKAVALAEGVLKTMLLTKLKIAGALLALVALLGAGAGALTQRVLADKPAWPPVKKQQVLAEKPAELPAKKKPVPADKPIDRPVEEKKERAARPAEEKKEDKKEIKEVIGAVKAVDAEKSTLTVEHQEGESTFTVVKDANVQIDGKPGKLADLPVGANVTLRQFVDRKTARSLEASGHWVRGALVKAVNDKANTLTVVLGHGEGEKTFTAAKDASVHIDGKPGKLVSVPKGAVVNLSLCVDQKTARTIQAEGRQFFGVRVKAVDAEGKTITFDDKAPREVAGKALPVAGDAHIGIDGKAGKLAGLPAGAVVHLTLCADQKTVRSLSAEGAQVGGHWGAAVKAVDAEKHTFTFDDKAPAEIAGKTFKVARDAHITIDGKLGKLAAIPKGACVSLTLSVDQKAARRVNAEGSQVGGHWGAVVTAVDAEKRTVTFDDKAPAEVAGKTFAVTRDAHIVIDGKLGKLTGLPRGAFVNLGLCVDQKTARSLNAQGAQVGGCGGSPVAAVDVERSTITFDDKAAREVAGKTFTVAKNAYIVLDGKRGKLADLPTGARVNLGLCVDQKTARNINAQGPQVGEHGGSLVKAVDVEKGTITFADKASPDVAGKTFPVARDASLSIDGKPGKLADLPKGALVNLGLCVHRKTARRVTAQGSQVSGVVKAVDAKKNTITVGEKTYTVARDASIAIDDKPGKLAGLPAGATVSLSLRVDQKTVGRIQANSPRFPEGRISRR
jgi:RNA polymerase sigma factor (sigma-70 family)